MNHIPVLLNEVLDQFNYLNEINDGCFVDATLGAAGHAIALAMKSKVEIIGVDKDSAALALAQEKITKKNLAGNFIIVHDDFKNINQILSSHDISSINGALIDLGVSSMQLDNKDRGFSFESPDAPLDMRMDQEQKLSAFEIVNYWNQEKLEKIFKEFGEERYYRPIAKNICRARKEKPVETVGDLLKIVKNTIPAKARFASGKHYATNVFRALRIAVNEELDRLDKTIRDFADKLAPSGRLAIITFHSSEDRIVKNVFRELEKPCTCPPEIPTCVCGKESSAKVITRKPIIPTEEEIRSNPRSRSAKLRVVEKI